MNGYCTCGWPLLDDGTCSNGECPDGGGITDVDEYLDAPPEAVEGELVARRHLELAVGALQKISAEGKVSIVTKADNVRVDRTRASQIAFDALEQLAPAFAQPSQFAALTKEPAKPEPVKWSCGRCDGMRVPMHTQRCSKRGQEDQEPVYLGNAPAKANEDLLNRLARSAVIGDLVLANELALQVSKTAYDELISGEQPEPAPDSPVDVGEMLHDLRADAAALRFDDSDDESEPSPTRSELISAIHEVAAETNIVHGKIYVGGYYKNVGASAFYRVVKALKLTGEV